MLISTQQTSWYALSGERSRSIGKMLRSGATRSLTRSFLKPTTASSRHTSTIGLLRAQPQGSTLVSKFQRPSYLAVNLYKPISIALLRSASTHPGTPFDHIDKKHEKDVAKTEIEPHPEDVSTTSSVRQVMHEEGVEDKERDVDMLAGVKADLVRNKAYSIIRYNNQLLGNRKPSKRPFQWKRFLAKPLFSVWQGFCRILLRRYQLFILPGI